MATLICRLQMNDFVTGVVNTKCQNVAVASVFAMWIMQMFLKYSYVPGSNYINMKVECSIYVEFHILPFEIC